MSFFRRDAEPEPPSATARTPAPNPSSQPSASRERAITRVADGTKIVGEISGATELLVEGEVEGQIRVESRVVIGGSGVVRGQVVAASVLVAGAVHGNVRGTERVEVGSSGRLEGDIAAPRVTIAEGAFFKGKVEMGGEAARRSPSPPRPEPPRPEPQPRPAGGTQEAPGLFPEQGGTGSPTGSPTSGGGGQ